MRIRTYSVTLCLWLLLLATAGAAPPTKPRVWTDQQGRQVTGRLLQVDDENVRIEVDGAPVIIPINQLSDDDQRLVTGATPATTPSAPNNEPAAPLAQPRFWTINGRQIAAQWSGADEAGFILKTPSGEMRVAYEVVTNPDDAAEAARLLKQSGRADLAEVVVAAYERNSGGKLSATNDKEPTPLNEFGEPAADSEDDMPEREKPKITTAEEAFAATEATSSTTDQAARNNFQRTALLGGAAVFVIIAAAIGIGWMMMRGK